MRNAILILYRLYTLIKSSSLIKHVITSYNANSYLH